MVSLPTVFVLAAIVSGLSTVVVARVASRLGAVDRPDGERKLHERAVPVWGGVAVFLAVAVAALVAMNIVPELAERYGDFIRQTLLAAGGICLIGAIDDRWSLRPRTKLLLQIAAVVPLAVAGFCIEKVTILGVPIYFGWFGVLASTFWLVACINAINLLDGMDGLASLVGLIVALMTAVNAIIVGNMHAALLAVGLAGALSGFLIHNLPPARIFLGDSGSMLIGLMLGLLGIASSVKTSTTLTIAVPLLVMSLPILDTVLAIVRRKLTGRGIGEADRQHIHHRLLERGLSEWQTLLVVGGLCLATGIASIVASSLRSDTIAWLAAAALLIVPVSFGWFGHYELHLLHRTLKAGVAMVRRSVLRGASPPDAAPPSESACPSPPFPRRWQWLVRQAEAQAADHVELILHDGQRAPRRVEWKRPGVIADSDEGMWRIAVSIQGQEGQLCQLTLRGRRAASLQPRGNPKLASLAQSAALEFAAAAETIPGVALLEPSDADRQPPQHRAA